MLKIPNMLKLTFPAVLTFFVGTVDENLQVLTVFVGSAEIRRIFKIFNFLLRRKIIKIFFASHISDSCVCLAISECHSR